MEEKVLMEFAAWLPESGIKEFEGKSPEECLDILDAAAQKPEGEKLVQKLFGEFKATKQNKTNSSKADYLKTLRAQNGTKVDVGDHVNGPNSVRHDTTWGVVEDKTDPETKRRTRYIENRYGDRIRLSTGPHGDSTISAHPVLYYDERREGSGYNPYVLDYETSDYHNAAAWTTRPGIIKVIDTIFGNWKWDPTEWEKARNLYGPYLKKAK